MNYLYLPLFNLRIVKSSVISLFCLFLFACSSTEVNTISADNYSDNRYSKGYIKENFSHTAFTPINENTIKRGMNSDHQLMLSILNRSMTADQAMMLAFEHERDNYSLYFSDYAVEIKGDKSIDTSNIRANNVYSRLISQDRNALNITAPN